ncbi:MAG: DUF1934 family protein [Eubacteriales bacterium]
MDNNNEMYSANVLSRLEYAARGEVPVKLTLSSRHILPELRMPAGSLFSAENEAFEELGQLLEETLPAGDEDEDAKGSIGTANSNHGGDSFEFCTTGGMKTECGVITISYAEGPDCAAEIIYDTGKPDMVTIHRSGGIMNTLVLEKGKRHISIYKTPIMPFEAASFAKNVESNLTFEDGGEITLDYLIELRGTDLQRTKMVIRAEIM